MTASAACAQRSRPPRMGVGDVGGYYIHADGSVWRLVGYASAPTATLESLDPDLRTGERRRVGGVVGAPIFEGFRRLTVVEEES